jgi:signal transduction histidine kinase
VTSLFARRRLGDWLALAAFLPAAALLWLGYRAVVEWEHAAAMVARERAGAAVDLLVGALARDMRGGQLLVLSSAERDGFIVGSDADLLHPIGSALARYPYPDAFFSWRDSPARTPVVFYSRSERRPSWLTPSESRRSFPLVVGGDPDIAARLAARVMRDGAQGRRNSVFDMDVAGSAYQVVAILSYADALHAKPAAILGFMVNLQWARENYFKDLIGQVARIEGNGRDLRFTVLDERGDPVVGSTRDAATALAARRVFPMAFFDPLVVAIDPPQDLHVRSWTAIVTAEGDVTLAATERGARRTLYVAGGMALALTIGLVLSVQAGRASARLADMRSDFVSAVTHELKTPIANLRAISETLASPRSTLEMSREYARMAIREAMRLTRLVDNLLAYARITDVADAYAFEPVALETIVERSLQEFTPLLTDGGFEVNVDLPEELPTVRGDPTALGLMLNNLLDNAIRYSQDTRHLTIAARPSGASVVLEVTDKGIGIPESEIGRVTRKFFRGRNSIVGGSGLGLAIVDRIVADHSGSLEIQSFVGTGTTVVVTLPVGVA